MVLAPRLELRQRQSLVMTPQLQQAIKLLQLNNLELSEYVEQELERNPLLERAEPEKSPREAGEAPPEMPTPAPADGHEEAPITDLSDLAKSEQLPGGGEDPVDGDLSDNYEDRSFGASSDMQVGQNDFGRGKGGSFDDNDFGFDERLTEKPSLVDHLTQQLQLEISDPIQRTIGHMLIDSVDMAGYCRVDVAEIADKLGIDESLVLQTLKIIQGFDPVGIAARDLKECLALQLAEKDRLDPIMAICLDHLDLLAKGDFAGLCRVCGCDREDLAEMIQDIRQCDPKPGLAFDMEAAQPMIPDVFVRVGPDGGWLVELNSDTLPKLLVNHRYHARVSKRTGGNHPNSNEVKTYVSDCLSTANWLVKALDQRANTILKVSSELVSQQSAFLKYGIQHLKPLTLKDIAAAVDLHESTISRVTANKFIGTPRGIFELKYFFTASLAANDGGDAHSAEAVRHKIKELIDQESRQSILSDDDLVELLKKTGIVVARRTVAKYREGMNIPSSVERRRAKKLQA